MPVHAKKTPVLLAFGFGLGRERAVMDLGFFERL